MNTWQLLVWRNFGARVRGMSVYGSLLVLGVFGFGCSLPLDIGFPNQAFKAIFPGTNNDASVDPVETQEQLLRSANIFLTGVNTSIERLKSDRTHFSELELQSVKIAYTTTTLALATGPNAIANLLDLIVLTARSRLIVEAHWLPEVHGEAARPFLKVCREAETQLWQIATPILTVAQQEELRQAIHTLHQQDRVRQSLLLVQALAFVSKVPTADQKRRSQPTSVFSLLMLDPLSGLDPAARELAETRLFAERALFIVHWMPNLLRWEMELFSLQTAEMPQLQQFLTSSTQLAAAADRFSQVAEQLPTVLSTEREQLFGALTSQQTELSALAREVQQTLETGGQMADSTTTTLETLQEVMTRFNPDPSGQGAEPFSIREYTEAATQIHKTAEELVSLLQALDGLAGSPHLPQASSQLKALTQHVQTSTREAVDYVFQRALLLVLLCCGAALMTALVYRLLNAKLMERLAKK